MSPRTHLPLFFLALAIAITMKVTVHETEQLSERTVPVNVTYTLPQGVMLVDSVNEVRVQLRGQTNEITLLNPFTVQVVVEVGRGQVGSVEVNLDRSNVRTPGDFEVVSITPNQLRLGVERVSTAVLPVRARLVDEPAAGSLPGEPEVRPSRVQVSGPASRVAPLEQLTAPVSLRGHALTFEETVPVLAPDPLVTIEPPRVVVHVPMNPPQPLSSLEGGGEQGGGGR